MYFKKLIISASLITSICFSSVYSSGYPVVDLSSVLEMQKEAQQSVEQFNKTTQQMKNLLNSIIQGQATSVDAMNNGFANSIIRQNQALDDTYNKRLKMQMQPSQDACSTYSVSTALNNAICGLLSSVSDSSESRANSFLNQKTTLTPNGNSQKNAKDIIDKSVTLGNQESGQANNDVSPMVVRADIMLGSQGDTYNKETQESTKLFNNIVIGTKVQVAPSKKNADGQLNYVENYLRPIAIKSIVANSLDTIRSLRLGQNNDPSKPSVIQIMQKFVDSHFGTQAGDTWIKEVTNTQKNASDYMSDSSVLRSIAQMQAFENYLSMMRYQSELRVETIDASILALTNKQVFNN